MNVPVVENPGAWTVVVRPAPCNGVGEQRWIVRAYQGSCATTSRPITAAEVATFNPEQRFADAAAARFPKGTMP